MKTKQLAVFVGFALVIGAGAAFAETPDGETPSEESVCDILVDATPGLYGLCVAYCEAHDAELVDDTALACNPSDSKLLDNYNKKMKPGDPPMPCILPDCPCFGLDELSAFSSKISCSDHTMDPTVSFETLISERIKLGGLATVTGRPDDSPKCKLGKCSRCTYRESRSHKGISMNINFAEAQSCRNLLLNFGDECFN